MQSGIVYATTHTSFLLHVRIYLVFIGFLCALNVGMKLAYKYINDQ